MNKILMQYWNSDEREADYMTKINKNPEYVQIRKDSAKLSNELMKLLGEDKFSQVELSESDCLVMAEKTAFELGFEYACDLMQALGFGGVVNG